MAALAKLVRFVPRQTLRYCGSSSTLVTRNYWNKDWKPGPFPETPEEKAAAAKKYGLRPEDYQALPPDGIQGYGDYPALPVKSYDNRSDFEAWDIPEQKRNYGEPLHVDWDMYTGDRVNIDKRQFFSMNYKLCWFICVFGGLVLLYEILEQFPMFDPAMPKQYPYKDPDWTRENKVYGRQLDRSTGPRTHYTFEPVE